MKDKNTLSFSPIQSYYHQEFVKIPKSLISEINIILELLNKRGIEDYYKNDSILK